MGRMGESVRLGVQNDYLQGLDNLRKVITSLEIDIDNVRRDFYQLDRDANSSDLKSHEEYLHRLNEQLEYGNNRLQSAGFSVDVIDSETRLVEFLDKIQDLQGEGFDGGVVGDVTAFWEHIKDSLHRLQAVNLKFQSNVMKRLESICSSYQHSETNLEFSAKYSQEVSKYQSQITDNIQKINDLVKGFPKGIDESLFTMTNFSRQVLVTCDTKAFPILCIVPDLSEKLVRMCRLGRQWVDKDETYVYDISHQIREKRSDARRKERELRAQREKRAQISRSVMEAHKALRTYRERLIQLEEDVNHLEVKFKRYSEAKQSKKDEIRQKAGIVGFLDISISQTKKNYSLQLKKARIVRQLKELESTLKQIEQDVTVIEKEVIMKNHERSIVEDKIDDNSRSYKQLKVNLNRFTENVNRLQREMVEMAESLTELETIQTFKTSPEKVEDLYDKPQSVKLAPSLKEKIARRKNLLRGAPQPQCSPDPSAGGGFFLTE